MRSFAPLALLSLSLLGRLSSASPDPLTGETSTRVAIDRSDERLEGGELVLHVLRTDDLLSDFTPSHERSLILERLSHVVVTVQLSTAEPTSSPVLRVNDENIDLAPLVKGPSSPTSLVQVVKAEAMRLPKNGMVVDGKKLRPEEMVGLAEHALPKGIVSVELTIEQESSPQSKISSDDLEGASAPFSGLTLSMQSFNVFIKINSIEHLSIPHSTTVMIPLLKLEIQFDEENAGLIKATKLKTFALRENKKGRGRPHHGDAHEGGEEESERHRHHVHEHEHEHEHELGHGHGHEVEGEKEGGYRRPHHHQHDEEAPEFDGASRHLHHEHSDDDQNEDDFHPFRHFGDDEAGPNQPPHPFHPHHHHEHHGPPAFVKWIADLLGFKPPPRGFHPHPHHHHGPHHKHPHDNHDRPHEPKDSEDPEEPEEPEVPEEGEKTVSAAFLDDDKRILRHHQHTTPSSEHEDGERKPCAKGQGKYRGKGRLHHAGHRGHRRPGFVRHLLHSPAFFIAAFLVKAFMVFGLAFIAGRKYKAWKAKRAEGAVRLEETDGVEVEKEQLLSEKQGLPIYIEDGIAKA